MNRFLFPNTPEDLRRRKLRDLWVMLSVGLAMCAIVAWLIWFSYNKTRP